MKTILFNNFAALALFAAADAAGGAAPPKAAPKAAPAPATPTPAVVAGFALETGIDIPPSQRIGSNSAASPWPFKEMAVGQSFLVPVEVPETIKDDKERAAAFKELARKASNRVSGAIRRFKKQNDGTDFAIRTVNDDTRGHGVRVWRIEVEGGAA